MKATPRQRAALLALAGAGIALLALWLLLDWDRFQAEYRFRRLEACRTFAEARPWLDALTADAARPGVARAVVANLGPERQWLTLWFFEYALLHGDAGYKGIILWRSFPSHLGTFLPVLLEFKIRLERDEKLLSTWSHYLRWRADVGWYWKDMNDGVLRDDEVVFMGWDIDPGFRAANLERESNVVRGAFLRSDLVFLGYAWLFGMSPLPKVSEDRLGRDHADNVFEFPDPRMFTEISDWLEKWKPYLRYEDRLGRCAIQNGTGGDLIRVPAEERGIPAANEPLPCWRGPAPEEKALGGPRLGPR